MEKKDAQSKVTESISIEQFKKIVEDQSSGQKEQTAVLKDIRSSIMKDSTVQLIQASHQEKISKEMAESNESSEKASEDLIKVSEKLLDEAKESGKSLEKFRETSEKQNKLLFGKLKEADERANRVTGKSMDIGLGQFKTIGDRINDFKKNFKDMFTLRGALDKTGVVKKGSGGIADTYLARREDASQYAKDMLKTHPNYSKLKQFGGDEKKAARYLEEQRGKQHKVGAEMRKNQAEIERLKKAGFSDQQIGQAGLFNKQKELSEQMESINPLVREKEDKKETAKKETAKKIAAPKETAKKVAAKKEIAEEKQKVVKETRAKKEQTAAAKEKVAVKKEAVKTTARETTKAKTAQKVAAKEAPKGAEQSDTVSQVTSLGSGIKDLGDSAKTLLAFAGALWISSKAFQNFAEIDWSGIGKGVVAMGSLAVATKVMKDNDSWKSLLALSGALWVSSKAFQNFSDVEWSSIGKGVVAIGGLAIASKAIGDNTSSMLKGALGLTALGASLYVIGASLEKFTKISWEDLGKAAVAIGGLALGAAAIGQFAAPIALGAAVLAGLGASLWIVGKAIEATADGFDRFVGSFKAIGDIDGSNLLKVGAGLAAVGAGMAVFAAGNAAAGLANLVSGFLNLVTPGKTPIEQLMDLAKVGPDLEKAGNGVKALAEGLQALAKVDKDTIKAISALPADKIAAMGAAIGKMEAEKTAAMNKPGAQEANAVYGKSADNAAASSQSVAAPIVVNAPTSVSNNNSSQNVAMQTPIRNEDGGLGRYVKRSAMFI